MTGSPERASAPPQRRWRGILAALLALVAAPAWAQAPTCAWGDGVVLPGGDTRDVLITQDGGAGVIAVSWEVNIGVTYVSTLRLHHVLEQGVLDPNLPATGVLLVTPADHPDHHDFVGLRLVADGSGGAYLLYRACNSTTAHLRCWELSEIWLLHTSAQGTPVPGWPARGVQIGARQWPIDLETVDIVGDGAGGVIAAWIDSSFVDYAAPAVFAQRFASDGSTLWAGGGSGLLVLARQTWRSAIRVASDHAGGCTVVASQAMTASPTQRELKAGRVNTLGSLPWTSEGKAVMLQPGFSAGIQAVAMDALGETFVAAVLSPGSPGVPQFATQLLTAAGARAWGLFGSLLGPSDGTGATAFQTSLGFVTLYKDDTGTPRYQLQDEGGGFYWGGSEGIPADWAVPSAEQRPLATTEGHVVSVWQASGVHAIELDEGGAPAPGWPATGAPVCGFLPGHLLGDAMIASSHVFVALASDERSGVEPIVQRLSRAVLASDGPRLPRALELSPPNPNPTRGDWTVHLAIPNAADVTLEVFDLAGRRVLSVPARQLPAGRHTLSSPIGRPLTPGVYRVRVRAGEETAERVLVRVR